MNAPGIVRVVLLYDLSKPQTVTIDPSCKHGFNAQTCWKCSA